jgi:hypothetical protein
MLAQGTAEKFLLAGLTSLKAIIYKGADYIATMHNLSQDDANALIEYAKKREEEIAAERAAAAAQPAAKVAASASPDAPPAEGAPAEGATATAAAPVAAAKDGAQ